MDTKKTIMVVDDNPDIITIVKTILEGKGYNVLSAYSGPELLTCLEGQKPDLIVLDIMMPQMDGLEVLTRLKGAPYFVHSRHSSHCEGPVRGRLRRLQIGG